MRRGQADCVSLFNIHLLSFRVVLARSDILPACSRHAEQVAFGAEVIALAGVGGWPARDTEKLCRQVNDLKLPTLMDAMDQLERGVVVLSEEGA